MVVKLAIEFLNYTEAMSILASLLTNLIAKEPTQNNEKQQLVKGYSNIYPLKKKALNPLQTLY